MLHSDLRGSDQIAQPRAQGQGGWDASASAGYVNVSSIAAGPSYSQGEAASSSYLVLDDQRASERSHARQTGGDLPREPERSMEVPEGWLSELGNLYSPSPSLFGDSTHTSFQSYVSSRASMSVDGIVSRSSTASRDSIAPVVKENFGDLVDKLRTIEGREATFASGWPHALNHRLSAWNMAKAGFLFTPDEHANDKVLCAYSTSRLVAWLLLLA